MADLVGKAALVTGGSSGFGRGMVEVLAAQGMRVTAVARNRDRLIALRRALDDAIDIVEGDVTDPILAARIIEHVKPHVLILNAGARGLSRPTRLHSWETFSTQFHVDVKSAFLWTREALLLPLEQGSTIFLGSSAAALRPMFVNAGYAAAKAAILTFAQGVAGEAKQLGIRVHCLMPVMAPDSEVGREALADFSKYTGAPVKAIIEQKGMQPPVTPTVVAQAMLDILTDPNKANTVGFRISGSEVSGFGGG